MTADTTLRDEADANQARASDPQASAWVSANAGTGKTAVLVKRVLRLLLAGAPPESILCLTYTKTAAAEMQNRLLAELSAWALRDDEALRGTLAKLMGTAPGEEALRRARRLFARVLEARGGLKIHTIHGFCERLLQRFPLEAAVTPHFTVLDEQTALHDKAAAFDNAVSEATAQPEGPLGKALATIVALANEDQFRDVVNQVLSKRAELTRIVARHRGEPDWRAAETDALKSLLDVAGKDEESLADEQADVLSDMEIDATLAAFAAFDSGKDTDKKTAAALRAARQVSGEDRVAAFRQIFFNKDGKRRARLFTKGAGQSSSEIADTLGEAQLSFAEIETARAHLRVVEASAAVLAFADAVQTDYEARKRQKAVLDYDDLIAKTLNLLSRSRAAAWVLYKIDGGIDHILVDEAQDTNPDQWSIVETLAEEFFAGRGASEEQRTLFAVGDEKQSIYSFQGANPVRFGETGRTFASRARDAGEPWHHVPLNVSFRSTVPVLDAVDHVFAQDDAARGLTFEDGTVIRHYAFRQGQAGLVELWEVETTDTPERAAPFEPWAEAMSGATALESLCSRIARCIRRWIDDEEPLESQGRSVTAGDILILVRRRDPFTGPMIRALKRARIPVAGADRMRLLEQLAVQDLIALADVLLMPEDDLALAVVLKSPLFGLDDDALFDLAHGREGSLWSALHDRARTEGRFEEAAICLSRWLGQADTLPPYEFYTAVLGDDSMRMRKRMLSRLGPEAAEAIDELLDHALTYDRDAPPSLQGFVSDLRADDIDIKRDMDQDRDEVRIMTVHGAKGLQAPIVILPDTCTVPGALGAQIYTAPRQGGERDEDPHILWAPPGHSGVPGLDNPKAAAARGDSDEYRRLLYVAMTRAEDRLYVCGWQGAKKRSEDCWYDLIERGLQPHLAPCEDADGRTVFRLSSPQDKAVAPASASGGREDRPAFARMGVGFRPGRALTGTSVSVRLAANATGEDVREQEQTTLGPTVLAKDMRFVRGRLVHALLQHLPHVAPTDRERSAVTFLAARGAELFEPLRQEIVAETLAIVNEPRFAPLFAAESLAEVPVVARIGEGGRSVDLEGQIDRLAILDDALLILDYKTNRPPPRTEADVAPAYIGQLSAYRLALRKMFPGKPIRAALLWTDGPRLMEISSALLDEAERGLLIGVASLDATGGRT